MLVLARELDERIMIGDDIVVTVVGFPDKGKVRIGIEAPDDVDIDREEVRESKSREGSRIGKAGQVSMVVNGYATWMDHPPKSLLDSDMIIENETKFDKCVLDFFDSCAPQAIAADFERVVRRLYERWQALDEIGRA